LRCEGSISSQCLPWRKVQEAKANPAKGVEKQPSQEWPSPLETAQLPWKPVSAAHRTPDKRRVALQGGVRNGGNRFAYISRYKSFSGLANRQHVKPNVLREVANLFSAGTGCAQSSVWRAKNASSTGKNTKLFHAVYQNGKRGTLLKQAPKKFKTLCTAEETCLPGEGKDREKDPRPHTVGCCFNGVWFHNCSGRWRQSAAVVASPGSIFGRQVVTDPNENGKALRLSCPCSWFNLSHR
jgi:hypothetical protein